MSYVVKYIEGVEYYGDWYRVEVDDMWVLIPADGSHDHTAEEIANKVGQALEKDV